MFVVDSNSRAITMTKGDTGSIDVTVTGMEFEEDDRAIWTVKNSSGQMIFERYYEIQNDGFIIVFVNGDTDQLPAGQYRWDLRFVKNPIWEDSRIVDGDVVATPGNSAFVLQLVDPVGEV